jgi:hypothetical protein
MNVNELIEIAFITLVIHIVSFLIGILLCNALGPQRQAKQHRVGLFTVIGFGMAILLLFTFIFSFISLDMNAILIMLISLASCVTLLKHRSFNIAFHRALHMEKKYVFFAILYLLSLIIFSKVGANICDGPSPGDIVGHLNIVSVIRYQNKMPVAMLPLSNVTTVWYGFSPQGYPFGLHAFAATVGKVFRTSSIFALITTVVSIVTIIPLILFEISFDYSNSLLVATTSFALSFFSPLGILPHSVRDFILSLMISGVFPNLIGILCFTLVVATILQSQRLCIDRLILILTPTLITSLLAYPLFLPLLAFVSLMELFKRMICKTNLSSVAKISAIVFLTLAIAQLTLLFPNLANISFPRTPHKPVLPVYNFQVFLTIITRAYIATPHVMLEFLTTPPGILVPISLFLFSVLLTLQGINFEGHDFTYLISLSYFLTFSISASSWFPTLFWWTISDRTRVLLLGLAYVIGPISISQFFRMSKLKGMRLHVYVRVLSKYINLKISFNTIIVGLIILAFTSPHLLNTYEYEGFGSAEDRAASRWIANNVEPTELILNDRSYPGLLIFSWRAFNAVNTYLTWEPYVLNRSFELNYILDRPFDYDSFKKLATKWNLRYIWITTENGYWSWDRNLFIDDPLGLGGRFKYRPYDQKIYLSYFDGNPWLSRAFSSGESVVYKVNLNSNISYSGPPPVYFLSSHVKLTHGKPLILPVGSSIDPQQGFTFTFDLTINGFSHKFYNTLVIRKSSSTEVGLDDPRYTELALLFLGTNATITGTDRPSMIVYGIVDGKWQPLSEGITIGSSPWKGEVTLVYRPSLRLLEIYLNGVLQTYSKVNGRINYKSGFLSLECSDDSECMINGIFIWDSALSIDQIYSFSKDKSQLSSWISSTP